MQAALQQRESDCQDRQTTLRAKETEALQLGLQLALQTTRISDLELASREAIVAAAAAQLREQELTNRTAQLSGQLVGADDAAACQVADAVAAALEGVSRQIADAEERAAVAEDAAQHQQDTAEQLEDDLQAQQEQLNALAAQLDSANGALIQAGVERDEARCESAATAASKSDTERRLSRSEASLGAANDLATTIRRQLVEQAAESSRQQAEAAGAKRLAAAAEQAVSSERQAAETLRQQLQEAAALLKPLQEIEESHLALKEELANATARSQRLAEAAAATDHQNVQLAEDLRAAQAQIRMQNGQAEKAAEQSARLAKERAALQEQLTDASSEAAAARHQVAQLQQAAAKGAAHTKALQAEHGSMQAALQAAQDDLQTQHDCNATAQSAAQQAAAEQEAYVQMTTEVISTLSSTTRQLEADLAAEQVARRQAAGDAAARDRAAQVSGAALEAVCSELRTVQDELQRQAGATAFHQKFATSLSLLLEDARSALAELHLMVSSLLASRRQDAENSTPAAGHPAAASASKENPVSPIQAAEIAKAALARAAACHGNIPLGRRRLSRPVQTAHCEMWSLAAGPWGRDDVRREVHAVMTGRAPSGISLRTLALADHTASMSSGHSSSGSPVHGVEDSTHGTQTGEHATAAAAGFVLRAPPPPAVTARTVQEVYAAKAAADAAARTACTQPLPLREFVRVFIEQQYGTGSTTTAHHMLDLLTGVAAHAPEHPTVAAFGLAAGILRAAEPQPAAMAGNGVVDSEISSVQGSEGDSTASQLQLDSGPGHSMRPCGHAAHGHNVLGSEGQRLELDPSFWQQQSGACAAHHGAALQRLYGAGSAAFTRLPFDPATLLQQRQPEATNSCQPDKVVSSEQLPAQQEQLHQGSVLVAPCLSQLRPLRRLRDWAALAHPSAAGVLSELLATPGMETALEELTCPNFVQRLQVGQSAILIGEQQAPALHCIFSSACAAAELPPGPEGPRLYVGTSTETAIYCVRVPYAAPTAAASAISSAVPQPPPAAAPSSRKLSAEHLQRSASAPPGAELHNTLPPGGAEHQAASATEGRPHSGRDLAAATSDASIKLQLDRSRWHGKRDTAIGGEPATRHQLSLPASCLAIVITGALVDLLQVHELQAALTAALGLAIMPPPGPADAPWVTRLPASLVTAGYYADPEANAAEAQDVIDRAFGSNRDPQNVCGIGSNLGSDHPPLGIQLPAAGADAGRLAAFRDSEQRPKDAAGVAAAAWQRLVPAIGAAGLAPAAAEAQLAAARLPRPAALLAALQRAGRHLTLCSDRVALASTHDVATCVSTLMKMTCGAATLEGQLSVDSLLQEGKSLDGHAAARSANAARLDGGSAVCGSLAVLRARELLQWSSKLRL